MITIRAVPKQCQQIWWMQPA